MGLVGGVYPVFSPYFFSGGSAVFSGHCGMAVLVEYDLMQEKTVMREPLSGGLKIFDVGYEIYGLPGADEAGVVLELVSGCGRLVGIMHEAAEGHVGVESIAEQSDDDYFGENFGEKYTDNEGNDGAGAFEIAGNGVGLIH